jgi:arginyl-tRNA synthetase
MTVSLLNDIKQAVADLYAVEAEITISRTEPQFGDYACNVAMQLAGKLKQPPRVIAETIANALKDTPSVESISVAGPGFLNIKLNDTVIADMLHKAAEVPRLLAGRVIVAEYSDPNPFKVLHAGHLYTSVVGDAVANVLEAAGAEVHRVNFGGDVGLHVGKTMWAILQELGGEHPQKLNDIPASERSEWMAAAYVRGTQAYEEDEAAKAAIIELNKKIYSINANEDKTSDLAQIYWTCRQSKKILRLSARFQCLSL